MSEKTRKMLVFLTLPLAVIWAVYNFMVGDAANDAGNTTPPPTVQAQPSAQQQTAKKFIDIEEYEARPWGKDPFRALAKSSGASGPAPSWILSGIVFNSDDPMAIINRQSVRTGDVVDKATVVEIKQTEVVLDKGGSLFTIRVTKG